VLSIYRREF